VLNKWATYKNGKDCGKKVVGKAILIYDQSVIFVTVTGSEILELKSTNVLVVVHHAYVSSYNILQTNA
jgi:hypothetical protein